MKKGDLKTKLIEDKDKKDNKKDKKKDKKEIEINRNKIGEKPSKNQLAVDDARDRYRSKMKSEALFDNRELEKPVDVILNCKWERGHMKGNNMPALTIYTPDMLPTKMNFNEEDMDEKMVDRIDVNESKQYEYRKVSPDDGLLFFYHQSTPECPRGWMRRPDDKTPNAPPIYFNRIKMLVCVTMYGEPVDLLQGTLDGIQSNLANFRAMGVAPECIVVVVIQDGILKMKKQMREFFDQIDEQKGLVDKPNTISNRCKLLEDEIKIYKDAGAQARVDLNNGLPPSLPKKTALLYQTRLEHQDHKSWPSMTTFFCCKHLNNKKLSSHMWFFEGFCRFWHPKYTAFIDVGTVPVDDGLTKYFAAMECDDNIGGVSGFLGLYFDTKTGHNVETARIIKEKVEKKEDTEAGKLFGADSDEEDEVKVLEEQQKKDDSEALKIKIEEAKKKKLFTDALTKEKMRKYKKGVCQNHAMNWLLFGPISVVWMILVWIIVLIFAGIYYALVGIFRCMVWALDKWNRSVDLRKAQLFEYTFAHMIDKNFESFTNFLHVLPGAWSAYRYDALKKGAKFRENLLQKKYLKQVLNPEAEEKDFREANMFLAEDRILCLGIFCQLKSKYTLKYVPDATANTDAVDDFIEFMNQRRRWINSSWFALDYVLRNYEFHIQQSDHSWWQINVTLRFNMVLQILGKWNAYLMLSFYTFVIYSASFQLFPVLWKFNYNCTQQGRTTCYSERKTGHQCYWDWYAGKSGICKIINPNIPWSLFYALPSYVPLIFCSSLLLLIFASLTFKVKAADKDDEDKLQLKINRAFNALSAVLSLFSFITFCLVFYSIYCNVGYQMGMYQPPLCKATPYYSDGIKFWVSYLILGMIGCNLGLIVVIVVLHLVCPYRVWDLVRSTISYLYYQTAYMHTLLIFAFCHVDDVTWGTKGLSSGGSARSKYYFSKVQFVGTWLFVNVCMTYFLIMLNEAFGGKGIVTYILGSYASIITFSKTSCGIMNHIHYYAWVKWRNHYRILAKKDDLKKESAMVTNEFKKKDDIVKLYNEVYQKDKRQRMISNI